MAPERSSGYFFDVRAWNGSRAVQRMSFSERGVYKAMLDEQWEKRNLPDDAEAVAEAIACTPGQVAEVLAAWSVVRRKFVPSKGDPTRIFNAALERTRRQQRENRRKHQVAGSSGGKAAAANREKQRLLEASNAVAPLRSATAKTTDLTRSDVTRQDKQLDPGNQQQAIHDATKPYVEEHQKRRRGFRIR